MQMPPRAVNVPVSMQQCNWRMWCRLACNEDAAANQGGGVVY